MAEYQRLRPRSMEDFDKRRSDGVPSWITIARMNSLTKWSDLLRRFDLSRGVEPTLYVSSTSKSESALLELRRTLDKTGL